MELEPVDHDPFATPKPGQTVAPGLSPQALRDQTLATSRGFIDVMTPEALKDYSAEEIARRMQERQRIGDAPGKIPELDKEGQRGGWPAVGALEGLSWAPLGGAAKVAGATAAKFAPLLSMFAGPAAKTADHAALDLAKQMAAKGMERGQIWDATGWFTGADGKWRFEIPDHNSIVDSAALKKTGRLSRADQYIRDQGSPYVTGDPRLNENLKREALAFADQTENSRGTIPMRDYLLHDDLYKAYPELMEAPVGMLSSGTPGLKGTFNPKLNITRTAGGTFAENAAAKNSNLLHELQHKVQAKEGLSFGGNPEELTQFADKALRLLGTDAPQREEIARKAAFESYRRLSGEVEARNVQARMNMMPEQRRATPPWTTEDVPREQQIVRGGGFAQGGRIRLEPVEGNPFVPHRADGGEVEGPAPAPSVFARHFAAGGRVDAYNIDPTPTEAQKKAGNYAKDHVSIHGLDIAIENAKGASRSGVGRDGKPWSVLMPAHYGYIKGTVGKDKDHVDVYIGPHPKSPHAFVVDQVDADTKAFDEHKVFFGFGSRAAARRAYLAAFSDGRGHRRLGHMADMTVAALKDWLASGNTQKPIKADPVAAKLPHAAVGYVARSRVKGAHCSVCSMYGGPNQCRLVAPPISPDGWCRRFDAKTKS